MIERLLCKFEALSSNSSPTKKKKKKKNKKSPKGLETNEAMWLGQVFTYQQHLASAGPCLANSGSALLLHKDGGITRPELWPVLP
jgi:hypothetical protein